MIKKLIFNKICREIKSLKIQSATTLAKKAFYAYKLIPNSHSKKILLSLRPTEPLLYNILNKFSPLKYKELIDTLNKDQEKINQEVYKIIKNKSLIFTHCHSTTLTNALIYAKKHGKHFEVYNTETRPMFQGRKTSKELRKAGIKVTMFIDSAALLAMVNTKTKKVDYVLLGADAITDKGVINKIGSRIYAELAKLHKIPLYIVTNSLKYTTKPVKIESRNKKEVWNTKSKIKILNPAFELIPKKDVTAIISELGTLKYDKFLKKIS
jgi:ribose 1,5-bisphosphate isomerase